MINNIKQFSETDQIFYSDGYKLAQAATQKGFEAQNLISAIESLYAAIDGLNDSLISLAKRQNSSVACSKGCHWCCHQAVYANSYELQFLSGYIKKRFSAGELADLFVRIQAKTDITSMLNEEQILKYKFPCPMLIDSSCSVYPARPMACRIYLATKLEPCLEFFHNPENDNSYPALLDFPLQAGRMMNEGFCAALKENGIETSEFRLEEGLQLEFRI